MPLDQKTAIATALAHDIPLNAAFHALPSDVVLRIADAARAYGYREPKNANGSRARYFYAYLTRAAAGPKWATEHIVQGNYGFGFEDECTEDNRKDGVRRLREYRENGPGQYRLITRKAKQHG